MFWILLVLALLAFTFYVLRGEDLSGFDIPGGESFDRGQGRSAPLEEVEAAFTSGMGPIQKLDRAQRLKLMREYMDGISDDMVFDATITPANAAGVPAEWVVAPGANANRRVLYIHGGAFMMGSPKSHRNITTRMSALADAAVLAIDYRLMPENSRRSGIEDCRTAWRWLLQNGPEEPGAADFLLIAGDSAGGNLTLSLTAWLRDEPLRSPDGAVALSPLTDSTFASPSIEGNLETDFMLGPMFGQILKMPRPLLWWVSFLQNRASPSDPDVSPVYGNLADLPPTLVHASEHEILFDDARRYVNRARVAGSPVSLQSWPHVPHVWHMFHPQLEEANEAWQEIRTFIAGLETEPVSAKAA